MCQDEPSDTESNEDSSAMSASEREHDDEEDIQPLDIEESDFAYGEIIPRRQQSQSTTRAVLSPSPESFQNSLTAIIYGFSDSICKSTF